jgi:large subunit ribosomal protein L4
MKFKIYSPDGSSSHEAEFDIPAFEGDRGVQAVKEVVVAHQANARLGTHSTKRRGEVRGGGKKPWRQKGTGRARAGSTRSPLWPGGGVVFGPKPRDYTKKINAKVKALAFSRALFDRATAGDIEVIESFEANPVKTKVIGLTLNRIAPAGKVLIVDEPFTPELRRAARNLARVTMQDAGNLNTLDLCQYRKILVSSRALEKIIVRASAVNGGN